MKYILCPFLHFGDELLNTRTQIGKRITQLRNQYKHHNRHDPDHAEYHDQHTDRTGDLTHIFPALNLTLVKQMALHKIHRHIQHERDRTSKNKGKYNVKHKGQSPHHNIIFPQARRSQRRKYDQTSDLPHRLIT